METVKSMTIISYFMFLGQSNSHYAKVGITLSIRKVVEGPDCQSSLNLCIVFLGNWGIGSRTLLGYQKSMDA